MATSIIVGGTPEPVSMDKHSTFTIEWFFESSPTESIDLHACNILIYIILINIEM